MDLKKNVLNVIKPQLCSTGTTGKSKLQQFHFYIMIWIPNGDNVLKLFIDTYLFQLSVWFQSQNRFDWTQMKSHNAVYHHNNFLRLNQWFM